MNEVKEVSRDVLGRFISSKDKETERINEYYRKRLEKPMLQIKPVPWGKDDFSNANKSKVKDLIVNEEESRLENYKLYLKSKAYE